MRSCRAVALPVMPGAVVPKFYRAVIANCNRYVALPVMPGAVVPWRWYNTIASYEVSRAKKLNHHGMVGVGR
jgi:hypothetical protein